MSAKAGPSAVADILTRIEAHLAAHGGYVAFSGGKDSLSVLDLARRVEPDVPRFSWPTTSRPSSLTSRRS